MKPIVVVHPCPVDSNAWVVVAFNGRGQWTGMCRYKDNTGDWRLAKESAMQEARKWRRNSGKGQG